MLKPPLYTHGILALIGPECSLLMAPQQPSRVSATMCMRVCGLQPWRMLEMEKKKLPSPSHNVSCVAEKHRLLFTMPFIDPTSRPLCTIYFSQLLHGCNNSLSESILAQAELPSCGAPHSLRALHSNSHIHVRIFMHKYSSKGCPDLQ